MKDGEVSMYLVPTYADIARLSNLAYGNTREYWRWTGSNMRCGTWLAWPYKDLHGMFAAGVQTNLTLNSFLNGRSLLNNVVCDLESSLLS